MKYSKKSKQKFEITMLLYFSFRYFHGIKPSKFTKVYKKKQN